MDVSEAIQKLGPIRDQFLVRFYTWSKAFSRREFDQSFPIVGRIKNASAQNLVFFANSLSFAEKHLLCSVLLKRFHERAVELLDDFPSVEDSALLERYSAAQRENVSRFEPSVRRSNKTSLRKILLRTMETLLGKPQQNSKDIWTYRSQVGSWTVETWIDTGGRRSFGYGHSIAAQDGIHLQHPISILGWMGISSQTDWFDLSEDDSRDAADCLLQACTYFLDAAPKLLEGLSHELPEVQVQYWRTLFTVKGHQKNGLTTLGSDEPELRKALRGRSAWSIPTSIIPQRLRKIGSHVAVVQDPSFTRENSDDPLALTPSYKHVRVEPDK